MTGQAVPIASARGPALVHEKSRSPSGITLAALPLLLTMPFLYFPKVIESDLQPWVMGGTVLAFLFYWPRIGFERQTYAAPISIVAVIAVAIYWFRAPEIEYFTRFAGIIAVFLMLWNVASRGFPNARLVVRATMLLWFAFGLYETQAARFGLPVIILGRYEPGRSGVPSLTAEPSFYGSISVLMLMYLLTDKDRRNIPYIFICVANVLLSGSVLSLLLLLIPAWRLPIRLKIAAGVAVLAALAIGVNVSSADVLTRLRDFDLGNLGPDLLRDVSTNLRAGHAWFTLVVNLWNELTYHGSADFMLEYNAWAVFTGLFVPNESDIILSSGGELLFRGGPFGAVVMLIILVTSYYRAGGTLYDRIEKLVFVFACLLNPVSLANPFFVLYMHKRYRS